MDDKDQKIARLESELKEWKDEYEKMQARITDPKSISFLWSDALLDPVVFYDSIGIVLYVNTAFTRTFGWTLEEFKDQDINFAPADKSAQAQANSNLMPAGEKIKSMETSRYTKDGKQIRVRENAASFYHPDGSIGGYAAIFEEISDSRHIKEMLIQSEEKYRSVMEAAADPIIVYDNQGRVTYFNPAFSRVFQWSLSERINKKMDDFVPEKNWPETLEMIQMVKQGKVFSGIESARYNRNGNIIPVSISGSTYKDKNNTVIGSIINLQDISERKQAENSIKQQDKLKVVLEMAGAVCHELSQPAMIIEGYADLFLMNLDQDDPLSEKMGKLKNQVARIGDLAQKLMNITKYKTREYRKGMTIVDIDRASQKSDNK